jgi:hypothetical protein
VTPYTRTPFWVSGASLLLLKSSKTVKMARDSSIIPDKCTSLRDTASSAAPLSGGQATFIQEMELEAQNYKHQTESH